MLEETNSRESLDVENIVRNVQDLNPNVNNVKRWDQPATISIHLVI